MLLPDSGIGVLSPQGKRFAVWASGRMIRIYDTDTGRLLRVLYGVAPTEGHTLPALAWSADGTRLAAVAHDLSSSWAAVWDVEAAALLWKREDLSGPPKAVSWSPDGKMLAVGLATGEPVQLLDSRTGKFLDVLAAPPTEGRRTVKVLAWSADGTRLAAVRCPATPLDATQHDLVVWEIARATILFRQAPLDREGWYETFCSWSPNGQRLLCLKKKGSYVVLETEHFKTVQTINLEEHPWSPRVTWSPDGLSVIAIQGHLGTFDAVTGKRTQPLQPKAVLEEDSAQEMKSWISSWSLDGRRGLFFPGDGIGLIELPAGKTRRLTGFAYPVRGTTAWSADGRKVAVGLQGGRLFIWDPTDGKLLHAGAAGDMHSLAWHPTSDRLLTMDKTGIGVFTLSKRQWRPIATAPLRGPRRWLPDEDALLVCLDGKAQVLAATTGEVLRTIPLPQGAAGYHVALGSDRLWTSTDLGQQRQFWDVKTGQALEVPKAWQGGLPEWSPGGKEIGIGTHMYDLKSSELMRTVTLGSDGPQDQYGWSPRGSYYFYGTRLHDARTGQYQGKLPFISTWSPDETALVKVEHGAVRFWDFARRQFAGCIVPVSADQGVSIGPTGHYRATSPYAERQLVYVVQSQRGQEVLSATEMQQKYQWQNDPDKVRLVP